MPGQILLAAGSNAKGQLSTGDDLDQHVPKPISFKHCEPGVFPAQITNILHIAGGANHTLLLATCTDPGLNEEGSSFTRLWGCGDGSRGQLGRISGNPVIPIFVELDLDLDHITPSVAGYTIEHIAAAWETSFVALRPPVARQSTESDVLIAMGANDFGDLGHHPLPRDGPNVVFLNDALRRYISGSSPIYRIEQIVAGPHHVIAILSLDVPGRGASHVHIGWGASRHGQLQHSYAGSNLGRPLSGTPKFIPPTVVHTSSNGGGSLSVGQQHTVMIDPAGDVRGTGSNKKGQLEGITTLVQGGTRLVRCTWNGTYIFDEGNDLFWSIRGTGSSEHGQLGCPIGSSSVSRDVISAPTPSRGLHEVQFPFATNMRKLDDFICGSEHVLALLSSGVERELWGWGWNEHGNLGVGHTEDVHTPVLIWPRERNQGSGTDSKVSRAWAGCGTTWLYLVSK